MLLEEWEHTSKTGSHTHSSTWNHGSVVIWMQLGALWPEAPLTHQPNRCVCVWVSMSVCEDVESVWDKGGRGRIEGGRSTAVPRDKKLWDCRVERRKKAKKTDGYTDSVCVCAFLFVCLYHNFIVVIFWIEALQMNSHPIDSHLTKLDTHNLSLLPLNNTLQSLVSTLNSLYN